MHIRSDHWLARVRRVGSPNFDARPAWASISLIVIHNISLPAGQFGTGYIERLFCNSLDVLAHPSFSDLAGLRVSSHVLINRRGRITQFVPFDQRAWHAGVSTYQGMRGCNSCAVGIELEGTDTRAYTSAQYRTLSRLCRALLEHYPGLSNERIVGHQEIAPDRKTDPGPAFDWQRLLGSLL
ncbi:MAG: 1,6-anhydro-N-acetylmuramyl-L-alanine amidase AmpD [Proteobacteria bacterium]|nr:1,6-anhydro-N-acetylmuramyl-L-alanine amidase AmpD [Pseudomonadota bacterium]